MMYFLWRLNKIPIIKFKVIGLEEAFMSYTEKQIS